MSLKPLNQTENYARKEACAQDSTVVECRFSQGSEIAEILAVHPTVALTQCEMASGRINYGGRLICTVVYVDEEGKLCRMQKGAEFSRFADDELFASDKIAQCTLKCAKTNIKRDGSAFVISSVITAQIVVYGTTKREYLCEIEGAITNPATVKFTSAVAFSGESETEDDFEVDGVDDVLLPHADAIICECVASSGEIKISGEICLSMLAMRGETPVSLDRVIPFRSSLVCDRAQLNANACANVQIKDLSLNATVNEDRGKCYVEVSCQLLFNGVFFEENETSIIADAFSTTNELKCSKESEDTYACTGIKTFSQRISAPVTTSAKIDYTCSFKAVACPRIEYEYDDKRDLLQGALYTILIYEQNGELRSCSVELPFSESIKLGEQSGENYVSVAVCGISVRQQTEGGCVAEAVLKISACGVEKTVVEYVNTVVEGDEIAQNDSAITVFIADANEGLWQVAKRLKKHPTQVMGENPDLKFPTTGDERILIYRPKAY